MGLINFLLGIFATIAGSYIITFYFGPLKKYKETVFKIDKELKLYADVIVNGDYQDINIRHILRNLSSELEASYKFLKIKKILVAFKQTKKENDIKLAAKELIRLSNISPQIADSKNNYSNKSLPLECADILDQIRDALDIKSL